MQERERVAQHMDPEKLAALYLSQATHLLIATGAGFSADSGLAVYRDVANFPAYRARNLGYMDLCSPHLLESDPALFLGFWGTCFNDYRTKKPHAGYDILRRWVDTRFSAPLEQRLEALSLKPGSAAPPDAQRFFIYSSNVDHHFATHGFPEDCLLEIHGHTEQWQCQSGQMCSWDTWPAPREFKFVVDPDTMLASEFPAGASAATNPAAPAHEQSSGGVWTSNWPKCHCGKRARPAVYMFGDFYYVGDRDHVPFRRFSRFKQQVPEHESASESPTRLVIIEMGAGKNVPTVRDTCEKLLSTRANAALIRINLEHPGRDENTTKGGKFIGIQKTSLEALQAIDAELRKLGT
eukprot:TRINITY_DN799_c0_g1_i1.p1 TRINITY_DN799_c0_g1~~TRINITY_DN799_c0_g1_i1.p1  ORF type:complete len:351 (-),score=60.49 TRINITY_DN799_c0_g1_i1:18-1070(-)